MIGCVGVGIQQRRAAGAVFQLVKKGHANGIDLLPRQAGKVFKIHSGAAIITNPFYQRGKPAGLAAGLLFIPRGDVIVKTDMQAILYGALRIAGKIGVNKV